MIKVISMAALIVAATAMAQTDNLIPNGDFSAGSAGWVTNGNVWVSNMARFNSGNTAPDGNMTIRVPTRAGLSYDLSFRYRVTAYRNGSQEMEVKVTGEQVLLAQTIRKEGTVGQSLWGEYGEYKLGFTSDGASAVIGFRDVSTMTDSIDSSLDDVVLMEKLSSGPLWSGKLLWDPNDPKDHVTSYRVYYSRGTNDFRQVGTVTGETVYELRDLTEGSHRYRVTAVNERGESDPSEVSTDITTIVAPTAPPGLRLNLTIQQP